MGARECGGVVGGGDNSHRAADRDWLDRETRQHRLELRAVDRQWRTRTVRSGATHMDKYSYVPLQSKTHWLACELTCIFIHVSNDA